MGDIESDSLTRQGPHSLRAGNGDRSTGNKLLLHMTYAPHADVKRSQSTDTFFKCSAIRHVAQLWQGGQCNDRHWNTRTRQVLLPFTSRYVGRSKSNRKTLERYSAPKKISLTTLTYFAAESTPVQMSEVITE